MSTRDKFRNKTITQAIVAPFKEEMMWHALSRRIGYVQRHIKGTRESNAAMRHLKVFFRRNNVSSPPPPTSFLFFLTSPGMRHFVRRVTTRRGGKFDHRVEFKVGKLANMVNDKLMWILFQLVTGDHVSLKGLDPITYIIELCRLVESGKERTVHVPASVYPIVADLALYAELWVQFDAFATMVFYHMSAIDHEVEEIASQYDLEIGDHLDKELDALCDPENEEKFLRLGHTVHHTLDVLQYPMDRLQNKATTEIMQQSESNLDKFWDDFDKHVKKHCPKYLVECWEEYWPQKGDLKRTQAQYWTHIEMNSIISGLNAVSFGFGSE